MAEVVPLTSAKSAALVEVAVSATTLPAAPTWGVAAAAERWECGGAAAQLSGTWWRWSWPVRRHRQFAAEPLGAAPG